MNTRFQLGAVKALAVTLIGSVAGLASATLQIYVSPSGSDSNSGLTSSTPVKTLGQAQVVLHNQRAGNTALPAVVNVAAGRYQLTSPLMLTNLDSNVTWQGVSGGQSVITGGTQISGWSKFLPSNIKRRLSAAAINGIYSAVIPSTNLGTFQRRGGSEPGTTFQNQPAELLLNGVPMSLARFPATGFAKVTAVAGDGYTLTLDSSRRVAATTDAWVQGFWSSEWWETWEPLTAAAAKNGIQVSGITSGTGLGPVTVGARLAIVNSLEDLNQPGQYYIDRTGNRVYFYPPYSLSNTVAEISQLDGYLVDMYQTSNTVLQGLVLQGSRGQGVQLFACTNSGLNQCTVRGTQLEGVVLGSGSSNFVKNTTVTNTGSVGIAAYEGTVSTLTSGNDLITNNMITAPGRMEHTYRPAIWLHGVGATVSNNTIMNCPGEGIIVDGCNHLVTQNDISHTCQTMNDVGVIYQGGNVLNRGNVISMNIIHDNQPVIQPASGGAPEVVAVYLDNLSSGFTVNDNIMYNDEIGVLIGGGRSNTVSGNAFSSVGTPVWFDGRGMSWMSSFFANGGVFSQQIAAMSTTELALFKATYPDFLDEVTTATPGMPLHNTINVAYFPSAGIGVTYWDPTYTNGNLGLSGLAYNGNTLFVSPSTGNFGLNTGVSIGTTLPTSAGSSGATSAMKP